MKETPTHFDGITDATARKLEQLAQFVETIPRKQFNMGYWAAKKSPLIGGDGLDKDTLICEIKPECGTVCCIAGWQVISKGMCIFDQTVYKNPKQFAAGNSLGAPDAIAAKMLGLGEYEASKLYIPWKWPLRFRQTPNGAAKRIRHFIKTGE